MNPAPRTSVNRLVALAAALLAASSTHAAVVRDWQGSADSTLLTPENWVGGVAPVAGNALRFGVAGTAGAEITIPGEINFGYAGGTPAIAFTAGASAYVFSGQSTLTIGTGAINNSSGQIQTFNLPIGFNTGNTYALLGANSGFVFGGTMATNADTTSFSIGTASSQTVTLGGEVVLGHVNPANPKNLHLNGSSGASTVTLNGATNPGITGNLRVGSNTKVFFGSPTGLSAASTVTLNGVSATLINSAGTPFTSPASLVFNSTAQAYAFGATGQTAANNLTFTGTAPFTADFARTLTLNGNGLTVSSAAIWNSSTTGTRTITVNNGPDSSGNTFGIGGLAIGAVGETADVQLALNGSAGVTVSGGVTNGLGTGTRALQYNGAGTLTINGASNYSGPTGVGGSGTLLVNGTHTGGTGYTVAGRLGGTGTIDLSATNSGVNFTSSGLNRRLIASSVDSLTIIGGAEATALHLTNAAGRTDDAQSFYFTLGAPGSTVVDVQGVLNLGSGTLEFNDFVFTSAPGFGPGVYRLFDYTSSVGTLGAALAGTVDGIAAVISQDTANTAIILTVGDGMPSDTTPPVITLNGDTSVSIAWGSSYTDAGATATDNVDPSVSVLTDNPVNSSVPGVYTVTYDAMDLAGNAALPVTRTVTVAIADAATPGADGLAPLVKYAFGATSPTDTVQTPVLTSSATTLSLTAVVRTNDPALVVSGETNTDLALPASWTSTGVTVTDAADQTNLPANCVRRVYTVDLTGAPRKFLRLSVSRL